MHSNVRPKSPLELLLMAPMVLMAVMLMLLLGLPPQEVTVLPLLGVPAQSQSAQLIRGAAASVCKFREDI
jgi:hypothetical protein